MMTDKKIFLPILVMLVTLLGGCSSLHFPGVYRIDIPQGNFVTDKMLDKLQPGMTTQQVRFVLGPPMIVDPFTPDTWYYLMTYRPGNGKPLRQQLVVTFKDGHYSGYSGHVIKDFRQKTSGRKDRQLMQKAQQQEQEADSINAD